MSIKNIIFTAGLLEGDDYLMEHLKQWRGDILVEDECQNYFELTFIAIDRLAFELQSKNYCTENWGWVVVNSLNVDIIVESIKALAKLGYFSTQKPKADVQLESHWTVISIQ